MAKKVQKQQEEVHEAVALAMGAFEEAVEKACEYIRSSPPSDPKQLFGREDEVNRLFRRKLDDMRHHFNLRRSDATEQTERTLHGQRHPRLRREK